jgi:hypothetical protein
MASVTVTPEEWKFVFFDGARIAEIGEKLLAEIGLDADVRIEVDETTPLGRVSVTSIDPVVLAVEGGAFEDAKRPRHPSERGIADVLGKWFYRVRDRRDPAFGAPPDDGELSLSQSTAWDTYCVGRLNRLGYPVQRQRRLYHFRNRHGFSDVGDAAFEQLWTSDGLTWAQITALSDDAAAAVVPA